MSAKSGFRTSWPDSMSIRKSTRLYPGNNRSASAEIRRSYSSSDNEFDEIRSNHSPLISTLDTWHPCLPPFDMVGHARACLLHHPPLFKVGCVDSKNDCLRLALCGAQDPTEPLYALS